jgi:hypothetical protein
MAFVLEREPPLCILRFMTPCVGDRAARAADFILGASLSRQFMHASGLPEWVSLLSVLSV